MFPNKPKTSDKGQPISKKHGKIPHNDDQAVVVIYESWTKFLDNFRGQAYRILCQEHQSLQDFSAYMDVYFQGLQDLLGLKIEVSIREWEIQKNTQWDTQWGNYQARPNEDDPNHCWVKDHKEKVWLRTNHYGYILPIPEHNNTKLTTSGAFAQEVGQDTSTASTLPNENLANIFNVFSPQYQGSVLGIPIMSPYDTAPSQIPLSQPQMLPSQVPSLTIAQPNVAYYRPSGSEPASGHSVSYPQSPLTSSGPSRVNSPYQDLNHSETTLPHNLEQGPTQIEDTAHNTTSTGKRATNAKLRGRPPNSKRSYLPRRPRELRPKPAQMGEDSESDSVDDI